MLGGGTGEGRRGRRLGKWQRRPGVTALGDCAVRDPEPASRKSATGLDKNAFIEGFKRVGSFLPLA
jgi:hypothetical protein